MVLSVTPATAEPMTISGYAWGHIVATGPQQTAVTSAPLILTHDPSSDIQALNAFSKRRDTHQTHFESFVSSS